MAVSAKPLVDAAADPYLEGRSIGLAPIIVPEVAAQDFQQTQYHRIDTDGCDIDTREVPSVRQLIGMLLACVASCTCAMAIAAPVLTFSAQIRAGDPTLVDLSVRAEGLAPDGLAAVHVDFGFDTSSISLVSATAGDFFIANANGGSLWTDTVAGSIAAGDDVLSSVLDATSGPDAIGFDLLEVLGFASIVDGVLLNMVFDVGAAGSAQFTTNDVLLVDALGVPTFQAGVLITAGDPGTVPEPGGLGLSMLALAMLARARVSALRQGAHMRDVPRRLAVGFGLAFFSCLAAAQALPPARLDLNVDGVVSTLDSYELRKCYGKPAGCDPRADFDDDGTIGVKDLSLLSASYGRKVPPPTNSILTSNLILNVSKSVVRPGESFTLRAELRGIVDPAPRVRWYLPDDVVVEGATVTRSLTTIGVSPIGVGVRLSDGTLLDSGTVVTVTDPSGLAPASLRMPARFGDVDRSGAVTLIDAYRVYRQLGGVSMSLDATARDAADFDRDGKLTDEDARQVAWAAISGSAYVESLSPQRLLPGTIVTLRSAALINPSGELTIRVSGSGLVQRPMSFVPGIATFLIPFDVALTGASTPGTVTVLDGAVEKARFLVRIEAPPTPVADPQATVIELLNLLKASLTANTARVAERALAAGLSAADQNTLKSVALAGERQGLVEIDALIRILNGNGGRRAAQIFAAALQANGFEDLPALLAELRAAISAPIAPVQLKALRRTLGIQAAAAADTACDIALSGLCPLKTVSDALDTGSTVAQIGCTALLAGAGAAILFPGDGPLIDVATLTLWVSTCSKIQVAIETAATVADLVGGIDADLTLTATPTSLSTGESAKLVARLNVFGIDELCSLGGTLGAQKITEKLADRIIGRLLSKNAGLVLVKKAFETLGGDYLNTFLNYLRSATSTTISKTSLDHAIEAAAQALCPAGGLCNPAINTKAALTGPNAGLVIDQGDSSALFTCPARTPTSPSSYSFPAQKDFCGNKLEAAAQVSCASTEVTITMGDNGSALDDIYEVLVDGITVLTSSVPVRGVSVTIELNAGQHAVSMLGRAAPDGIGTYYITIMGARIVSGDATSGSDLTPGRVKNYLIEVQ